MAPPPLIGGNTPLAPLKGGIHASASGGLRDLMSDRLLRLWYAPLENLLKNPVGIFLKIAARFYEKGLERDQARLRRISARLPAFVVSVGNIAVGGTGKTPLTLWLCRFLVQRGRSPAVLSRGYGRKGQGPARVPSGGEAAVLSEFFGDEPVLMARDLPSVPIWVGRRRLLAGQAALRRGGIDTLVLDDGFQHLAIDRDLDIVLLNCRNPFGNGLQLPAGPLREPPSALKRADAFVITHADLQNPPPDRVPRIKVRGGLGRLCSEYRLLKENPIGSLRHPGEGRGDEVLQRLDSGLRRNDSMIESSGSADLRAYLGSLFPDKPVFACRHMIGGFRFLGSSAKSESLKGRKAVVFAGIARPEDFFRDLEEAETKICAAFCFPDHHRYSERDILKIFGSASENSAELVVTTAKDGVRIPAAHRGAVAVAEMELDFGPDLPGFCGFLLSRLGIMPRLN